MRVEQLVDAIAALDSADALQCRLTVDDWRLLAPYLSVRFLKVGDALLREGDTDRELFIVAEGELEVRIQGSYVATIRAGNVVGEGTFFSASPRSATVTPLQPGVAWGLNWEKFDAMTKKHPHLAVDLVKGLAAVLAIRMREALLVGQFT